MGTIIKDETVKTELERIELAGYKNVHEKFKDSFQVIRWNDKTDKENTKAQIVRNDSGEEICTLNETMHNIEPKLTALKKDGSVVTLDSYRTIDFPIKLDKADGTMHLSIVALDEKGNRPPASQAVYFTAHYEEGPEGKPILKEVSSPIPMKFMGEGKDAIGYIEHGDKIYTMPVTRGKYEEMMKEVAINKGQNIDLSQTVDVLAEDLVKSQNQEHPLEPQKQRQNSEITFSPSPNLSQVLKPPQAEISKVPEPEKSNIENIVKHYSEQDQKKNLLSPLPPSLLEEIAQGVKLRKVSESEKSNVSSNVQHHSEQIQEQNLSSPLPPSLLEEIAQGVTLKKVPESEKSNVSSNAQRHPEQDQKKNLSSPLPPSLLEEIAQGVTLKKVPESEKSNVSDKQSNPSILGVISKAFVDRNIGVKADFKNNNNSDNSVTEDEWDQEEKEYEKKHIIEEANKPQTKANNISNQQVNKAELEKLPSTASQKTNAQSSSEYADILKASLEQRFAALNPDKAEKIKPSVSPNVSKKKARLQR